MSTTRPSLERHPPNISESGKKITSIVSDLRGHYSGKITLIIRHSARHFDPNLGELKNPLTDEGRELSKRFGAALPPGEIIRSFSSPVGRCVETAELIGSAYQGEDHSYQGNQKLDGIGLNYVQDLVEVRRLLYQSGGSAEFIKKWFGQEISTDIIDDPQQTAHRMMDLLKEKLKEDSQTTMDLCVSHDWTLYLLKDQLLGMTYSEFGKIEYLDGLVLYQQDGQVMVTSHQLKPRAL